MKKILAVCLILVFSMTAFADQAAIITKAEAEKAVALLKGKKQIKHYCAPCGDKSIETEDIQTVEILKSDYHDPWQKEIDYWEVKINGKDVDLAYIYFELKKGKWKNVAIELDIVLSGVPKFLPKNVK